MKVHYLGRRDLQNNPIEFESVDDNFVQRDAHFALTKIIQPQYNTE